MGVGTKKERAKKYSERMDEARTEELEEQSVLQSPPVEMVAMFECESFEHLEELAVGRQVLLLDLNRDLIDVFLGGKAIGFVLPEGTSALREQWGIDRKASRGRDAEVVQVSSFGNAFTVKLP